MEVDYERFGGSDRKGTCDHPDEVSVSEKENGRSLTVELHVAPSDMGKVIGKQGRIAKAISHCGKGCGRWKIIKKWMWISSDI